MIGTNSSARQPKVSSNTDDFFTINLTFFSADQKRAEGKKAGSDDSEDDRPKKKTNGKPNGKVNGKVNGKPSKTKR